MAAGPEQMKDGHSGLVIQADLCWEKAFVFTTGTRKAPALSISQTSHLRVIPRTTEKTRRLILWLALPWWEASARKLSLRTGAANTTPRPFNRTEAKAGKRVTTSLGGRQIIKRRTSDVVTKITVSSLSYQTLVQIGGGRFTDTERRKTTN